MLSSNDLLHLGAAAARAGAEFLRTVPKPAREAWERKGTNDFVTEVDGRAEEIIAGVLLAGEPGATVVGEELAPDPDRARRGLAWIVDPLDGTTNFLHVYAQWAVSLAGFMCPGQSARAAPANPTSVSAVTRAAKNFIGLLLPG